MNLSPHFTLDELTESATALRLGIDNTPLPWEIEALTRLCEQILEPLREHFGKPVAVTSGYRSPRVNGAVGSKPSSQHCKGEAADIKIHGVPNLEIAEWIKANTEFDQCILEYPPGGWVHVSHKKNECRYECLRIDAAGTFQGLV